jgi:hypothetical protein
VQAPFTQAPLVHALPVVQVPDALHVCMVAPLQRVAPGVHTSAQAPFTQALLVHALPVVQVPDALHVCTVAPLQRVAPGVHRQAPCPKVPHGTSAPSIEKSGSASDTFAFAVSGVATSIGTSATVLDTSGLPSVPVPAPPSIAASSAGTAPSNVTWLEVSTSLLRPLSSFTWAAVSAPVPLGAVSIPGFGTAPSYFSWGLASTEWSSERLQPPSRTRIAQPRR